MESKSIVFACWCLVLVCLWEPLKILNLCQKNVKYPWTISYIETENSNIVRDLFSTCKITFPSSAYMSIATDLLEVWM